MTGERPEPLGIAVSTMEAMDTLDEEQRSIIPGFGVEVIQLLDARGHAAGEVAISEDIIIQRFKDGTVVLSIDTMTIATFRRVAKVQLVRIIPEVGRTH
jgi:hypothetical protein